MSDENKKTVEEPDFEKLAKTTAPSKFNKISKRKVLALNDVDILVTDSKAKHLETYLKEGLNVK